jgi:hypothetical protein
MVVTEKAQDTDRDNDHAPRDREAQMHDDCFLVHATYYGIAPAG